MQQAPGLMAVLRGPTHVCDVLSGAWSRLFDIGVTGRPLLQQLPPGNDTLQQGLDEVLRTGDPQREVIRVQLPSGPHDLDLLLHPMRDDAGEVIGVFVQGQDQTALRRLEAERNELLAREQATREAAESAAQLRDEFLATVSHELRTPLNSMLGWVQMLRSGSLPASRQGQALETIERNARSQAKLIADLLDVSAILAGKLQLERTEVDLRAIVDEAVDSVKELAASRQVQVHATVPMSLGLLGDAARLQQIVANLLSNAIKFTPAGGAVQIAVDQADDHVEIEVTDTGRGMDPAFQQHAFDRFRQACSSTTRSHGGLGLGLAIVRQLVQLHEGTVTASSDGEGLGSTFAVRLPLPARAGARNSGSLHTTPNALADDALAGLHVLLVEDEDDSRAMVATLLEGYGARVRQADRAAAGYELFQEETPDVVLSDIGMPDEDGFSFVQRLRELPSSVPAIALTAFAQDSDRAKARECGFSQYLTKPVEPGALVSALSSLRTH